MWGAPLRDRWRGDRDPRQARFLTLASLRWVIRHRAFTPWYLVRYARLLRFRLANPHVVLRENKIATGAGADRVSQGMRAAFGKGVGLAARLRPGTKIMIIRTTPALYPQAKEAMRKARMKRPTPTRIVCDAGRKTMSAELAESEPVDIPGVEKVWLSAEHGTIELGAPLVEPRVGDQIEFVVGYSDLTVALHDELIGIRDGRVETVWPLLGRGRLQ